MSTAVAAISIKAPTGPAWEFLVLFLVSLVSGLLTRSSV